MMGRRYRRVGVAIVLAATLAGCDANDDEPPRPKASGPSIETERGTATPYGEGAEQVWVLLPRDREVESVVVYLHGYGAPLPFEWHLEWMDELLERGNAVLFPRYQGGSTDDAWILTPFDLATGLQTGFRALGRRDVPVVAAGFSLGATLAAVYAARADTWHVPRPAAVYAIFPVDPILVDLELDLSGVAPTTRFLVLAGEDDYVAGPDPARELMKLLEGLPAENKEYRLIRTRGELPADHDAPTLALRPIVRQTYWRPLDALVDEARARG
jgi:pimeloyl-ACP methyl ester carboxylesterase